MDGCCCMDRSLARMEVTVTLYSIQSDVNRSNLVLEDFRMKKICVHN